MYVTVKVGSRGEFVEELQHILREKARGAKKLKVDGRFGSITRKAVLSFQKDKWLAEDAIVGRCTWVALKDLERYEILHRVHMVPQHTGMSCWSAATAMVLGVKSASIGPGGAAVDQTPGPDFGGLIASLANLRTFARAHGLTAEPPRSWRPDSLAPFLRRGPISTALLWNKGGGHVVTIVGMRGDGSAEGTTIRVYDPWPINRGSVYSLSYGPFMRKIPKATFAIFHA